MVPRGAGQYGADGADAGPSGPHHPGHKSIAVLYCVASPVGRKRPGMFALYAVMPHTATVPHSCGGWRKTTGTSALHYPQPVVSLVCPAEMNGRMGGRGRCGAIDMPFLGVNVESPTSALPTRSAVTEQHCCTSRTSCCSDDIMMDLSHGLMGAWMKGQRAWGSDTGCVWILSPQ